MYFDVDVDADDEMMGRSRFSRRPTPSAIRFLIITMIIIVIVMLMGKCYHYFLNTGPRYSIKALAPVDRQSVSYTNFYISYAEFVRGWGLET